MVMSKNIIDSAVSLIEKKGTWYCLSIFGCAIGGIALLKSSPKAAGRLSDFFYKKAITPIETKAKKELNDNATDNKIREIEARNKAEIEKMKVRETLRKERNEERDNSSATNSEPVPDVEMPPTYDEIINSTPNIDEESMRIFVPWFHWYENIGIVGMNNNGKSTFVRQIARSMALGYQESSICPEWKKGSPVKVLMFDLEHNKAHIKVYDAEQHKSIGNLHIETGSTSTEEIKAIIKKVAETAPDGLVVIIDNYTKLSEMEPRKAKVIGLANWMEKFKAERQAQDKPIAYINVYHTVKNFSPIHPLELKDVRGDSCYTMFSQEFLAMAPCRRGLEYRILKVLKNKYLPEERTVSVIRYANTHVKMYEYVEDNVEADELPTLATGEISKQERTGKAGRPKMYSDEEMLVMYNMVQHHETTWDEVQATYGITGKAIKKRVKQIKNRQ